MRKLLFLLAAAALLAVPGTGKAGLISFSSRAAFNAANPGLPVEDFEEGVVPPGGFIPLPAPLNSASSNAAFQPGDILPGITFQDVPGPSSDGLALAGPGFSGIASRTLFANTIGEGLEILFNPGAAAVGLDVFSEFADSPVVISVFGTSGLLGTTTVNARSDGVPTFFGVASDAEPITRITLLAPGLIFEGVDNVAFGTGVIPEPASGVLLGLGALGLLNWYRRRKQLR